MIEKEIISSKINSKVALYLRVSSLEQKNNGFGKEIQLNKIKNLIQYRFNNGDTDFIFDEKLIYQDLGISGIKDENDRPGLKSLLRDIEKGKIKKVIVWRLDRLARKTKLLLETIEFFDRNGVEFISTDENIDTKTPTGKFFLTILGALGEMERSLIAEKTYLGKLESAKKGQYPFGMPPFGFIRPKGEKILIVDKEKKEVVQKIFDMYINENKSLNEIGQILYSKGIFKSKDGSRVGKIISNNTYIGNLWVNTSKDVRDEKTGKRTLIQKPKEEHILIKVEPFVNEKVFKKAQKKLIQNKYIFNNNNKPIVNHYFAGLMQCGECGSNFRAYTSKKNGIDRIYYRCNKNNAYKFGDNKCSNGQLSEKSIIGKVFKDIYKIIENPKSIEKKYLKESNASKNIKKYLEEIKTIENTIDKEYKIIDKLYNSFESEDDERINKIIENKLSKSKNKILHLQNRIKTLKGYIKIEKTNNQNKKTLYEFSEKLKGFELKSLDRKGLIECFRLVIEKIVVYKNKIDIIYKYNGNSENKAKKITTSSSNKEESIVTGKFVMEVQTFPLIELYNNLNYIKLNDLKGFLKIL